MTQRMAVTKNNFATRRLMQQNFAEQKMQLFKQRLDSKETRRSLRSLQEQREDVYKLLEKLKKQNLRKPMLNGREISKTAPQITPRLTNDLLVKSEISTKPGSPLLAIVDLKPVANQKLATTALLAKQVDLLQKTEPNTEVLYRIGKISPDPGKGPDLKIDTKKPEVSVKNVPLLKPSGNIQPAKPRPFTNRYPGRRVVS